jgi:hypothetical protein
LISGWASEILFDPHMEGPPYLTAFLASLPGVKGKSKPDNSVGYKYPEVFTNHCVANKVLACEWRDYKERMEKEGPEQGLSDGRLAD